MAAADYSDALSYLQKITSTQGGSVYDHLSRVLLKILEERPKNAVDLLETSLLVKRTAFDYKESSPLVPLTSSVHAAKAVAASRLFGVPDLPIDPDSGEPIEGEAPNEYTCEDVWKDAFLFDSVGVGLGRQEMYNVLLAVKKLGEDPKKQVDKVRFFGKFFGIHADYYVFETVLKDPGEEKTEELAEGEVPSEGPGAGTNAYTYFVCNYLGGPFSRLPNVTPAQIKVARQIKKFLVGKLDAQVSTYPLFPGTEANYLRAQIARIAATTVCCPKDYFAELEEGEKELKENEEFAPLEGREYTNPVNWVHRYPHIKKQGRCEVFRKEPEGEEEEEEVELTEEEAEEGPELLRELEADEPVDGGAAWAPVFSSSNENVKNQVCGLRSMLWPGAVSVAQGRHFTNMYVGWGLKNYQFVPLPPPPVAQEYDQAMVESQELPPKPEPEKTDENGEEDA